MSRHRALVVGLLLALSLAVGVSWTRQGTAVLAAEQTEDPKPRPTPQTRPPGWSPADMPLTAESPPVGPGRSAAAVQTIIDEKWDGSAQLPEKWSTDDQNGPTIGGHYYWGIRNEADCWRFSEPRAVWATGGGGNGFADSCAAGYPNVANTWLAYGPFSLAGATSATLSARMSIDTEQDFDTFQLRVSTDGGATYTDLIAPLSGPLGDGVLTVPFPATVLGQPEVRLRFVFQSDGSNTAAGVYLDDVVLTAEIAGGAVDTPTPTATPTRTPTTTPGGGARWKVFVPVAIREGGTPTPTPTQTPPAGCQDLIANGGFEQATNNAAASWNIAGNVHYVTAVDGHSTPNIVLFAYTDAAGAGATGDLWQTVAVPTGPTSATLSFWFKSLAGSSTPIKLQIDAMDEGGGDVLLHVDTITQGTSDWQQVSRALSAAQLAPLAGRNVRLRIRAADITGPLDLFFDDVSWRVCR